MVLAVRWYLRFALSYRNVEELLAERGVASEASPICRWVKGHSAAGRGGPALPVYRRRPLAGRGGHVKVAGRWRYLPPIDQVGDQRHVGVSASRRKGRSLIVPSG
jgi:IS6 family transposase